ncbi:MAG: VanZ family protein [Bacteroides sp.]|jgi:VanZ family protein|nr:VanZ family protein [Bacteroides sp.]
MAFKFLLPALAWGLLILLAISLPPGNIPRTGLFSLPHFDKLVHVALFAGWGLLLFAGFRKQKPGSFFQQNPAMIAVAFGLVYGILTELLQHFCLSGRHGNYFDVIADVFGTVFGVLLLKWIVRKPSKIFI